MPLNSSGPLSMGGPVAGQSIDLELGRAASTQIGLDETPVRTLAGVLSGTIGLSNFYGKANALDYGFLGSGGIDPQSVNKITYSTNTYANSGLTSKIELYGVATVSSRDVALWCGAVSSSGNTKSSELYGISLITSTFIDPAQTLPYIIAFSGGLSYLDISGYSFGGMYSNVQRTATARIDFSSYTSINLGNYSITNSFGRDPCCFHTNNYGYATLGGLNQGTAAATASGKFSFSTETWANVSSGGFPTQNTTNIYYDRIRCSSMSKTSAYGMAQYNYYTGSQPYQLLNYSAKFSFSTETYTNPFTPAYVPAGQGISTPTRGYFGNGQGQGNSDAPPNSVSAIMLIYATDTIATTSMYQASTQTYFQTGSGMSQNISLI